MEIESIILLVSVVTGLSYFLFKRRTFDFYVVSYVSSVIYFIPSLVGYVSYSEYSYVVVESIRSEVVWAHVLILWVLLLAAVLYDRGSSSKYDHPSVVGAVDRRLHDFEISVYIVALVVGLLFVLGEWDSIVSPGKPSYGSLHSFFAVAVPIGFSCATYFKRKGISVFFAALLFVDVYAGNREAFVFALGGALVLYLSTVGPIRLSKKISILLIGFLSLALLLGYKGVYQALKAGNMDLVYSRIFGFEYWAGLVGRSEPFVIQAIFNYAIDFPAAYRGDFLVNIPFYFLPLANLVGFSAKTPTHFLRNDVFGDVGYGIASNIWAEVFVVAGWSGLIVAALVYALIPLVLNYFVLEGRKVDVRILFAVVGMVMCFFIHRTGLGMGLVYVSRFMWVWFLVLIVGFFVQGLRKKG